MVGLSVIDFIVGALPLSACDPILARQDSEVNGNERQNMVPITMHTVDYMEQAFIQSSMEIAGEVLGRVVMRTRYKTRHKNIHPG